MVKRGFDVFFSIIGLLVTGWLILLLIFISALNTRQSGIFVQERIGQYGRKFRIYKLRTIKWDDKGEQKISAFGNFLRKSKLDELPQLYNILVNDMSFVGPRPDIKGYYDELKGDDRRLLELKPGITSPASLKYFNEEQLLSKQNDPVKYNDEVIFPDKVKINLNYQKHRTFWIDLKIIFYTISGKKCNGKF